MRLASAAALTALALATGLSAASARELPQSTAATPANDVPGGLACPPDFLNDTETRMFAKDGAIRSGPWHARCFQNGAAIYDRDRIYVFCKRGDARASIEGADGHAIRFQFPSEIACVWER